MSNNSDTPPSNAKSESKVEIDNECDTYVISVPKGRKINKKMLKYSSIKKIDIDADALELINSVNEVHKSTKEIIQHVNNLTITCSDCFSHNKAEVKPKIDKASVV